MHKSSRFAVLAVAALSLSISQPALAGEIDFGSDRSDWAKDGECDDKRFEGEGMTDTPLLDEDIRRDATDCRKAYEQGRITMKNAGSDSIDWGNDDSDWANDGECDDMRFEGEGMTLTLLLEEDIKADATDCRNAFEAGKLSLSE